MIKITKAFGVSFRQSEKRRLFHSSSPAEIAIAFEQYVTCLIETLASDKPTALTIDCRGNAVLIRSLVNGHWFDVMPLTNDALSCIIPGKSTKVEAAVMFWDLLVRMHADATTISTADARERITGFGRRHLAIRLDAIEPGRGIAHLRLMATT